ncbi:ultra-long-chain fatty acid omega-hydroxylase-like [Glandiceps talaboti]
MWTPTVTTFSGLVVPFLILVALVQIVISLAKSMGKRWKSEAAFSEFPTFARNAVLGNIHMFGNNEEAFAWLVEQLQGCPHGFQIWLGPFMSCLACIHPSTIQPILSSSEPKDELTYGFVKPWLGDGLLISKGSKWFRNRRLLTPGFHFDILKQYVHVFNDSAKIMMEKWEKLSQKGSIELFEHVGLLTFDSLLRCIFGQQSDCQLGKTHPYLKAVSELTKLIEERGRYPPYFVDFIYQISPSGFRFRKAKNLVHNYSSGVIKKRKQELEAEKKESLDNKTKYIDFLDILLQARDEDGMGLTDQEIRDEVDTFMFEGHDTTASAISWCLYNLARNPEHQQKCREEIDSILDTKNGDTIEWDDLGNLPYLTMCIKESLRFNPTVPFIGRRLSKPMKLPELNVTIPAGEWIGILIVLLHRNPYIWDDPDTFDPLRFTPENSQSRSPYAYVPFSAGPRNCIGQNFAMNEIKIVVGSALRKFELTVDESIPARRVSALIMRAENGLHVHLKPRK